MARNKRRQPERAERPLLPRAGTVVEAAVDDRSWVTRVETAEGNQLIVVAPTRPMGAAIELEPGRQVEIRWPTELGVLRAHARAVSAVRDVVASWVLEVERTVREQRRVAFRLAVELAAALHPTAGLSVPISSRTADVSELGLACVVPASEAPEVGAELEVSVAIPDGDPVVAQATVVRLEPLPYQEGEPRETRLCLAMIDDDPERRERIRKFVLDEQLRRRRDGTL